MSEVATCKMCGGSLKIDEKLSLYVCEFCGTEFPLPAEEIERIEIAHKAEAEKLKAEAKAERKDINKKRMKKALPFIIVVFVAVIAALIIHGLSFRIIDTQMAADYDDNYRPIGEIKSYAPNNNKFILTGVVKNSPENTKLHFIWKYNDEILLRSENPLDVSNKKSSNFFATLPNEEIRPEGEYSVEIYKNEDSKPIKIVYFTVSKNTSDIYFYNLHMTSALKDKIYPIDTITTYPSFTKELILAGTVYNAPMGTQITSVWKHDGVKISTYNDSFQVANMNFCSKLKNKVTYSGKNYYFLSGSYSVEIYINNNTTPTEIVNFYVGIK